MRTRLISTLVLAAFLSGCHLIGWRDWSDDDSHRAEWEARSDGDYSFVMFRSCFCYPAGEFDVSVEDYEIVSMTNRQSGEDVPADQRDYVHTIDEMFDLIEEARKDAEHLDVRYSDEGYPAEITIDWMEQVADDELYYRVEDVVIPES